MVDLETYTILLSEVIADRLASSLLWHSPIPQLHPSAKRGLHLCTNDDNKIYKVWGIQKLMALSPSSKRLFNLASSRASLKTSTVTDKSQ